MPVKLGKKSRLGVGVNVAQESLGLFQNLSVNAQVSYKFRFLKGVCGASVSSRHITIRNSSAQKSIFRKGMTSTLPPTKLHPDTGCGRKRVRHLGGYLIFPPVFQRRHVVSPHPQSDSRAYQKRPPRRPKTHSTRPRFHGSSIFYRRRQYSNQNSLFSLQPSMLVRTDFSRFSAEGDDAGHIQ